MPLEIKPVEEKHFPEIIQGLQEYYRGKKVQPQTAAKLAKDHLARAIESRVNPACTFLVAVEKGKVVGFSSGINEEGGKAGALWTFSFKPAEKGKGSGVGTPLFKAKIAALLDKGAYTITGSS